MLVEGFRVTILVVIDGRLPHMEGTRLTLWPIDDHSCRPPLELNRKYTRSNIFLSFINIIAGR